MTAARLFAALAALACAAPLSAREDDIQKGSYTWLVRSYYAELPSAEPVRATQLGWHAHDGELEDLTPAGVAAEVARLRGWRRYAQALTKDHNAKGMPPDVARHRHGDDMRRDMLFLTSMIDARIFELEEIRGWRRWASFYPDHASESVYALIKREFAAPEARLGSVIARERKIPELLATGKRNLTEVVQVSIDIAIEQLPGTIEFFERDVPAAFPGVKDAKLTAALAASTRDVVAALRDYQRFLEGRRATARVDFAIGEAAFKKKLLLDEMVTTPLPELLARGEAELRRLQEQLRALTVHMEQKSQGKHTPREVLASVQADHPPAAQVIPTIRARLQAQRQFLVDKKLLTLPAPMMPVVQETPPFMRATTMASMDTPGPFETKNVAAFYNVTLPEATWSAAQAEDYLRGAFSRALIEIVTVHEAFPGHFIQFLMIPKLPSVVRKVESTSTNAEGWAHYCEQMMLDEGYGDNDAALRVGQLQDALLRAARFVVGIRMHTRGMTLAEAQRFFQDEGFQSAKVADMEAKRGAGDPTYLYYTLGKLEILKLRDDYKQKLGAAFTLKRFHDAFLAEGAAPLPLVREALLAN